MLVTNIVKWVGEGNRNESFQVPQDGTTSLWAYAGGGWLPCSTGERQIRLIAASITTGCAAGRARQACCAALVGEESAR